MEKRHEQVIVSNGVLYVPAWEWSSERDTLLGHHVRTQVKEPQRISETSHTAPEFFVTFANSWVIALGLLFADEPEPNLWVSDFIAATVYVGEGDHVLFMETLQTINTPTPFITPSIFTPVIEQVAALPSWRESIRASGDANALIERHIEPHSDPRKSGEAWYRLREHGTPVWAIIGALLPDGSNVDAVAEDYSVSREAIEAARFYYLRHRSAIDALLTLNGAA